MNYFIFLISENKCAELPFLAVSKLHTYVLTLNYPLQYAKRLR